VYPEDKYDQQANLLLWVENYKNKNILYISDSFYVLKENWSSWQLKDE
jgi:hypothetical protein